MSTAISVIDQHHITEALRRAVAAERVAHAYLFHGPDGVGKRAVALAFAQWLQCATSVGCGACVPCQKVRRMTHPDVQVLFPYPSGTDTEDVAARLQALAENPYAAIDFVRRPSLSDPAKTSNKQAFYPVARVHEELQRTMSFRSVEGRYKVAVLTDADLMRTEAANAFLKLLEEPPPRTVFVLTTSRPDRLLPTIISRCQQLRFDPLPHDAIADALWAREGIPADRAALLARMADGSYTRALDLAGNDELLGDRETVLAFLRYAYVLNIDKLADAVQGISSLGRERIKGLLGLVLSWVRDLMLYRHMGDAAPLINVDQAEAVGRFCRNVPDADLEAMATLAEEAIDLVERNVHTGLLLTALAHSLHRAMRGPHDGRLYVPLAEESAA